MFDARLRPVKQRLLAPLVGVLGVAPPHVLTGIGLGFGIAAALAAADKRWWVALVLFVVNRVVDGLDGDMARARSLVSDRGGYADIVADTVVYAAIPLGAAVGSELDHIWPITALLIAAFYLNTVTWTYLAAVLEKRGSSDASGTTSVVMPVGLVEGAETMLFFTAMLALPDHLDWTMGIMAATVLAGAGLRFAAGHRRLRAATNTPATVRT